MARGAVVQSGVTFVNRRWRMLFATIGSSFALAFLAAAVVDRGTSKAVAAGFIAIGSALFVVRVLIAYRMDVNNARLTVRSLLRTRSIPYANLSGARAITRVLGGYGRPEWEMVYVRLAFASGWDLDIVWVGERSVPDRPAVIETAAKMINERIRLSQKFPSP